MANQILNNLRNIHGIQKDGSTQVMLRDIKQDRLKVESLKKDIDKLLAEIKKKAVEVATVAQTTEMPEESAVVEKEIKEPIKEEQFENKRTFNEDAQSSNVKPINTPNNQNRFNRPQQSNTRYNNQNNTNRFNNQNNPRFNNGFNNQNGGNRFNNPNTGTNNRFANNQTGGFNNRFNNTNTVKKPAGQGNRFVSSKGNNFKSFVPLESSSVLAQPERQFGNKNKSDRRRDDEKSTKRVNTSNLKNNIIIEDENGFEETTMGSRKLIRKKKQEATYVAPKVESAVITTENVSVKTLSEKTGKSVSEIIKQLMMLGVMANINSTIDYDTAELVASELGIKLEKKIDKSYEEQLKDTLEETENVDLVKRPPVVTVMGHVDHGKTSLLDAIRKTNVIAGEAGGITQKIGAYQVTANGNKITFIDTPGHAAFTAMRARGAQVTDVAILVVAADDGIMPQTIEAINHIKSAKVPMIVAINKMDKPEANPDKIKQQLAEHDVLPEEWGGDAILVPISAKTGMGIDELLKMVILVADMQDLKAPMETKATGTVIEAELDKNRGPVATVLVQTGTLKVGDNIVSGLTYGKVKAMFDEFGKKLNEATPSTPVAILGLNEVPSSGDNVFAIDEKFSKQIIEERKSKIKNERAAQTSGVTLDDFMNKVNEGKLKTLNIIIKADTQGSVEALKTSLTSIYNEEVNVTCIHSAAGPVTESDIILANATGAFIINFNQKVVGKIENLADSQKVEVKSYKIIYEVVEDITNAINGMMTVKYEEKIIGHAEIRAVFKLSSAGTVAGCYITEGKAVRNGFARVFRGEEELGVSAIDSIKIVKDEKPEVSYGFECGIKLKEKIPFKESDTLEFFINEVVKRS